MLKPLLYSIILACGIIVNYQQKPLPDWIVGDWVNAGGIHEEWVKGRAELRARSYRVTDGDTIVSEPIRILWKGGAMTYIPTVHNQNEGKPVEFRMVTSTDGFVVSEHPDHDFPQRITYRREGDTLHADVTDLAGENGFSLSWSIAD